MFGSGIGAGAGSSVEFSIRNTLLLKLFRTFSFASSGILTFSKRDNLIGFSPLLVLLNSLIRLLCSLSACSIDKMFPYVSLKNIIDYEVYWNYIFSASCVIT